MIKDITTKVVLEPQKLYYCCMDKKLNRKILFDKSNNKFSEPAANPKPKLPAPKSERPNIIINPNTASEVVNWINSHKYFKWSPMCLKIGLDKSNFKRILESPDPVIPDKYLKDIIAIIKDYGYAK